MKWWVALLLALPFLWLGKQGQDIAGLKPVEVLGVWVDNNIYCIETDTGDFGFGESLEKAVADLRATSSGEIFLDTAEYLLVADREVLPELMEYLRPSCQVCLMEGAVELGTAAEFLRLHPPERTLAEYRAGIRPLKTLRLEEGRFKLVSENGGAEAVGELVGNGVLSGGGATGCGAKSVECGGDRRGLAVGGLGRMALGAVS